MQLIYFDEVKFQPNTQPFYWLAGVIVNAESIRAIEHEVDALAKECFSSSTLCRETEFHAADIFHRKHNFRNWTDPEERIRVIRSLATIIGRAEGVRRVYVQIDPERMVGADVEHKAFIFFVEKIERYLKDVKDVGLLIGDRESGSLAGIFAEILSRFREHGTPYEYGRKLERLIDTVHFTESHLSRMIQLADVYVWLLQLCNKNETGRPQLDLIKFVREETELLRAHRYKFWPTEGSWIKVDKSDRRGPV